MTIKTIAVSYERKFNLGDYNSLQLEATCWADLDVGAGDNPTECIRQLQATVRDAVAQEYVTLKTKLDARKAAGNGGASVSAKAQVPQP